jgi:alcohol dehydrogenase class IV
MDASSHLLETKITLRMPRKLVFGNGCSEKLPKDVIALAKKRIFIVLDESVMANVNPALDMLDKDGTTTQLWTKIDSEPTFTMAEGAVEAAREFEPDMVVGIGGGSTLDVAKVVAVLVDSRQAISDIIGSGKLTERKTTLVCLPTTSGTGSEVSPNAILLDEEKNLKIGIISPFLVPDAVHIDPELTKTLPPSVTAATGLDALTHCIEAYTNRFSHPMVDLYALEGVRLIGDSLQQAVEDGDNLEARTNMSLGSMYGGLCLGPVNTAAVHALSYPLGSEFHVTHGISNAVLLPHVMEFNLEATPERYARIGEALGVRKKGSNRELAQEGVEAVRRLMKHCEVPEHMALLDVPKEAIDHMAEASMSITRLLKNNPREMDKEDAKRIYFSAY